MSHTDEGTILAIRDGALVSADAQLHVDGCDSCGQALASVRERAGRIDRALSSLDGPVDVEAGKARVRARMDAGAPERKKPATRWHLGRAAAILLVAAGAAYALPGSPVPSWLGVEEGAPAEEAPVTDPAPRDYSGGIDVPVPDGRIAIVVSGAAPGTAIEVTWVDEPVARISSGVGSSYSFADGRAEATVVAGPVLIALPRSAELISVEVNGRMLLERGPSGLELARDAEEQSFDRILFSVPERR